MLHFSRGYSLIEVLVAVSMVSIALVSLMTIETQLVRRVRNAAQDAEVTVAGLNFLRAHLLPGLSKEAAEKLSHAEDRTYKLTYEVKKAAGIFKNIAGMRAHHVTARWNLFGNEAQSELVYFDFTKDATHGQPRKA